MPTISQFFGIVIRMYYNDHAPPHFHAYYGGNSATIDIETLEILEGKLPRRALSLIKEWGDMHRDELVADWQLAENHESLNQIPPLE